MVGAGVRPSTDLLNKQPRVAGAPEQGRLLQPMFKQGLESWAQGPSYKVRDAFCHSIIPRDGVLTVGDRV